MTGRARRAAVLIASLWPLVSFATDAAPGTASPAALRIAAGAELYRTYCIGCHGAAAAGCGTSARLYRPRPANLTASARDADYKRRIIREGGEALGRSPFMPPWKGQLDDDEVTSLIAWLGSLAPQPTPPC